MMTKNVHLKVIWLYGAKHYDKKRWDFLSTFKRQKNVNIGGSWPKKPPKIVVNVVCERPLTQLICELFSVN